MQCRYIESFNFLIIKKPFNSCQCLRWLFPLSSAIIENISFGLLWTIHVCLRLWSFWAFMLQICLRLWQIKKHKSEKIQPCYDLNHYIFHQYLRTTLCFRAWRDIVSFQKRVFTLWYIPCTLNTCLSIILVYLIYI